MLGPSDDSDASGDSLDRADYQGQGAGAPQVSHSLGLLVGCDQASDEMSTAALFAAVRTLLSPQGFSP